MSRKKKTLSKNQLQKVSKVFANARNQYQKDISYRAFAEVVGVSHSTIQSIENMKTEPSLDVINSYIRIFGGTIAYWLGESTCKELKNEEIHNLTGLTDIAINKLKEYKLYVDTSKTGTKDNYFEVAQRLKIINYLIENVEHEGFAPDEDLNKTSRNLLDNMYSFLFSDYDTKNTPDGTPYDEKIEIDGAKITKGRLLQKKDVKMIFLTNIQNNLVKMNTDIINKEFDTDKKLSDEF